MLLTNHAHVLACVARDPSMRLRDIARCVGITERAAHRIVCDLEKAGYVSHTRDGRRNAYQVHTDVPLHGELEREATVGELLGLLLDDAGSR